MIEIGNLSSVRILRRTDGATWGEVLEPIVRDTAGVEPNHIPELIEVGRLVPLLLNEIAKYPMPEFVIYRSSSSPARPASIGEPLDARHRTTPADDGPPKATAASFASALVAHRAERLMQTAELTAGALNALELGALQLSAVSTRALFELAVLCQDIHQELLEPWRQVHGSVSRVRAAANSNEFTTFRLLWDTRMATRFYAESEGLPLAQNIIGKIKRLNEKVPDAIHVYDMLCDATHPNIEANATHWRTDYVAIGENHAIRFAPGRSNSPVKLYVLSALRLSLLILISFTRDLWWVAADIANTCDMTPNDRTRLLGLPARTGRDDPCSCGSGLQTRVCRHPEPEGTALDELQDP